jgi:hypothetical protein
MTAISGLSIPPSDGRSGQPGERTSFSEWRMASPCRLHGEVGGNLGMNLGAMLRSRLCVSCNAPRPWRSISNDFSALMLPRAYLGVCVVTLCLSIALRHPVTPLDSRLASLGLDSSSQFSDLFPPSSPSSTSGPSCLTGGKQPINPLAPQASYTNTIPTLQLRSRSWGTTARRAKPPRQAASFTADATPEMVKEGKLHA